VNVKGSYLDPKKVRAMEGFSIPKFVINVKIFLGFTGYYTRFILRYAKIAKLLFSLI
jgi:hypothetical protein